ncbi:MAG: cytochrome c3 family protein [Luteibaculaceae bacterium]
MNRYNIMGKLTAKIKVAFAVILLLGVAEYAAAQDGAKIFRANCASCHRPTDQALVGPGLAGVRDRWGASDPAREDLLVRFIQNPNSVKDIGDSYINQLLAEWVPRAGLMPAQAVSKDEVLAILDWIDNYQDEAAAAAPAAGAVTASAEAPAASGDATIWMIVVLIVLIFVALSVGSVKSSLQASLKIKNGEAVDQEDETTFSQKLAQTASNNKIIVALGVVVLLVSGLVAGWNALNRVGVFTEYEPEQPIAFSHSIHAGQNGISCIYCHGSAEKSKHAGIPSIMTCMNCHNAIEEGKNTGKAEIAKIYEAVGWDPATRTYSGEEKPVKWIKVHNLPDHVYFNHKQHVVVGGVECATCHGNVEEMGVAKQVSSLTMGWCIDCHNQTEVKMEGNPYYDEMHSRMSTDMLKKILEDNKVTVKELGGWECAKCHY